MKVVFCDELTLWDVEQKLLFGSESVLGAVPRRSAAAAFQRSIEKRGLQGDLRLYLRLFLRLFGRQFGLK